MIPRYTLSAITYLGIGKFYDFFSGDSVYRTLKIQKTIYRPFFSMFDNK